MNLQPLKIPAGWFVAWNLLTDRDPAIDTIHEFTGSSLLLINSPTRLKAIDVSWRPEGDLDGAYQVQVICLLPKFNSKTNTLEYEGIWETPELIFCTKSRPELVEKVNHLLFSLEPFTDPRILLKPGIVDEPNEAIRQELLIAGLTGDVAAKIIASQHKVLQDLMLNHQDISKELVEKLVQSGAGKGVKNKAGQLLNSKRFKNHKRVQLPGVDKAKLITAITTKMETVLKELQNKKPEKDFTLKMNEANGYWSFHWKSTKYWKTGHYLIEWFSLSLYPVKERFSLMGSHTIKDIFEQLEDRHFLYKDKSLEALFKMIAGIEKQTQKAVLKSVEQEFDPDF